MIIKVIEHFKVFTDHLYLSSWELFLHFCSPFLAGLSFTWYLIFWILCHFWTLAAVWCLAGKYFLPIGIGCEFIWSFFYRHYLSTTRFHCQLFVLTPNTLYSIQKSLSVPKIWSVILTFSPNNFKLSSLRLMFLLYLALT